MNSQSFYDKEFYEYLGRTLANFQMLEQLIEVFTWSLIGTDQNVGQMITSQLSFTKLCDLSCSLFKYQCDDESDKDIINALDNIFKKVSDIENERNKIVHSKWFIEISNFPETEIVRIKFTTNRKHGLRQSDEKITISDFHEFNRKMKEVYDELNSFAFEMDSLGYLELPKPLDDQAD